VHLAALSECLAVFLLVLITVYIDISTTLLIAFYGSVEHIYRRTLLVVCPKLCSLMKTVKFTVNGRAVSIDVEGRTLLADALRDDLHLTGTHIGCDTSQCGCCTVLVNDSAVKSCTMLAVQAQNAKITTIEGLAKSDQLHPVQRAFSACHGLQCGFCTPGMIMATVELLQQNPAPDDGQIREGLSGNLCRCTGYINIEAAVRAAASAMQSSGPARSESGEA